MGKGTFPSGLGPRVPYSEYRVLSNEGQESAASVTSPSRQSNRVSGNHGPDKENFGTRFERFLNTFVDDVLSPGPLAGAALAAPVFNMGKLAFLSKLAGQSAGWWNRGIAARALASTLALPGEVGTFWGVNRLYEQYRHPERLSGDLKTIGREWLGLSLTFGLFKLNGSIFQILAEDLLKYPTVHKALGTLSLRPDALRNTAQLAGMYSGIVTANAAEAKLGWRPQSSLAALLTDSFAFCLQLKTMGHLSDQILGSGYAGGMYRIENQIQKIENSNLNSGGKNYGDGFQIPMGITPEGDRVPIPPSEHSQDHAKEYLSLMKGSHEGKGTGKGKFKIEFTGPTQQGSEAAPGSLQSLAESLLEENISPRTRQRLGSELYGYREQVAEYLERRLESFWRSEEDPKHPYTETQKKKRKQEDQKRIKNILHQMIVDDFTVIADKLHEWKEKFYLLSLELREEVERAQGLGKENLEQLLDRVEIKHLDLVRISNRAYFYLGEDKGPSKKYPFGAEHYPRLRDNYSNRVEDIQAYISRHKELKRILQKLQSQPIDPNFEVWKTEDVEILIEEVGFKSPIVETLKEAIYTDPNLRVRELVPLARVLQLLKKGDLNIEKSLALLKPLEEYSSALAELKSFIPFAELKNLVPAFESIERSSLRPYRELVKLIKNKNAADREEVQATIEIYLEAAKNLREALRAYYPVPGRRPLVWPEVRAQLERRMEKGMIPVTVGEQLLQWFEPKGIRKSKNGVEGQRTESVAGMMEFIFNERRTPEHRKRILNFFKQIFERKDWRMVDYLALRFQKYHMGVVGTFSPSSRNLKEFVPIHGTKSEERLLASVLETEEFYSAHTDFRGPYLEIVEKINRGNHDFGAQLAAPVKQILGETIKDGYQQVELFSRESLGSAVLRAIPPKAKFKKFIGVTSIQDPLSSRDELVQWLDKALTTMGHIHDGIDFKEAGIKTAMVVQIPRIADGVSKSKIPLWARDYLGKGGVIDEIELYLPQKGLEVPNPFDIENFSRYQVSRSHPTTADVIKRFENRIEEKPDDLTARYELYLYLKEMGDNPTLLAKSWRLLKETAKMFPNKKPVLVEFRKRLAEHFKKLQALRENQLLGFNLEDIQENLRYAGRVSTLGTEGHYNRVVDFLEAALGISLSAKSLPNLFNLDPVGFKLSKLEWNYSPRGVFLEGEFSNSTKNQPVKRQIEPLFLDNTPWVNDVVGDSKNVEPKTGLFRIKIERTGPKKRLRIVLEKIKFPTELRQYGAGTEFFSELIRLAREIGAEKIYADLPSGVPSYVQALWGMGFKNNEHGHISRSNFQLWARRYRSKMGGEWWTHDLLAIDKIKTPQELAWAHIDPIKKKLVMRPWEISSDGMEEPIFLDPKFQLGKLFLLSREGDSWEGVFDPAPGGQDSHRFAEYYEKRFARKWPYSKER